ncbi:unnamed protein product [Orchesella dallaii]|uniref:Uncharacterized protein n=1 Tax=Orchesella dallaii TaxID=48710 RepID=A0ABP1QQJ1_9HEXA
MDEHIKEASIVSTILIILGCISHGGCISEVDTFFQTFYHCLFHFNIDNNREQNDQWDIYRKILHFYAGVSPLTTQISEGVHLTSGNHTTLDYQDIFTIRRFSSCSINIQLCRGVKILPRTDGPELWRGEFLWLIFSSNNTVCNYNDVGRAPLTRYSAMIFGIFDFKRVHLLCLSCEYAFSEITNLSTLDGSTISHYKKLWKKLHSNLNGKSIVINAAMDFSSLDNKWNCNIHKKDVVYAYVCVYLTMMRYLNFTTIPNGSPKVSETLVHGAIFTRQLVNEESREFLSSKKLELVGYALNSEVYEYTIVLDQIPSTNLQALIQPFDWMTWICLIISVIMVAVVLSLEFTTLSTNQLNKFTVSLSWAWFPTMGLLVDQPASNLSRLVMKRAINALLWCQWCAVALNLSQFYKGSLFSFLSSSNSPEVPHNLDSILKTNALIFTLSKSRCFPNGTIPVSCSTLRDTMLTDLIESKFKSIAINYAELYKRTDWLGNDSTNALVGLVRKGQLFNKQTNTAETPKGFVFIDSRAMVNLFKMQITFFSGMWASKTIPLPLLVQRDGWFIKENYLHWLFKETLAQLYESGLYNRWNDFDLRDDIVFYTKKTAHTIHERPVNGSEVSHIRKYSHGYIKSQQLGISLANLFHYVFISTAKEPSVLVTLNLKVYLPIMIYGLVSLGLSGAVWFGAMLTCIPHGCCTSEIDKFLNNFHHCVFHFHVGYNSEQNDQWDVYSRIINFYAGKSPFTTQTSKRKIEILFNQDISQITRFSGCSISLQLCGLVKKKSDVTGTELWRREFMWFVFSSNDTECDYDDVATAVSIITGYSAIIFEILDYKQVHMLCLSCDYISRLTSVSAHDVNDIPQLTIQDALEKATFKSSRKIN